MRTSAFVDCDSESAVIRVPYDLLIAMLKNCPGSPDYYDLIYKIHRASARSKKLHGLLEEMFNNGNNNYSN